MSIITRIKKIIVRAIDSDFTKWVYKALFKILGKLPVKRNLVMFESFNGKQFSCNPRAIYEYMKHEYPEYELLWCANSRYEHLFKERDINFVRRFSLKWIFSMARAKYWVVNSRLPLWFVKPKHTTYIQTWHGTPLKRLAMDIADVHIPGTNTEKYKKEFTEEAKRWDYLVSPNAYSTKIFKRAFHYNKEVIESGYPRNDNLYNCNNAKFINELKIKMQLPQGKKIILYAPTWRDDQFYDKGRYKFNLDLDLKQMRNMLGNDYIILLRMHYLVVENLNLAEYEGFAYDFSSYEDIRDLYLVSDLLITDYSSVFFDYANLKRPMIFFVYDIDKYRDKLRGFYFDFENNAPGPLVKTTDQVISYIKDYEDNGFSLDNSYKEFFNRFCYLESGNSAKQVVKGALLNK